MTNKQINLLNRICAAQIYIWTESALEESKNIPDILLKIKPRVYASVVINRFDNEERKFIESIAKSDKIEALKQNQTSAVIQALEVLKLWTEDIPKEKRINLNVSDKKLVVGKNHYLMDMLKLKKMNKDIYTETKDVIDKSMENAFIWYETVKETIKEKW